jgi:hypothetical protein
MLPREGGVSQGVFFSFVHQPGELREVSSEAIGHLAPLLGGAKRIGLVKNHADGRSHHLLGRLRDQTERVPHEVNSAALPGGSLQDRSDGAL